MLGTLESSLWNLKKEVKTICELWNVKEHEEEEQEKRVSLRSASQPHPTKVSDKTQTFHLGQRLARGLRFDQGLLGKF